MLTLEFFEEDFDLGDRARAEIVLREFMDDIADYAIKSMRKNVPKDSERTLEHIHRGNVERTPYGFQVEVGVNPITETKPGESEYYPIFVHEGTGMFSDDPHWITPQHGNVMVFDVADAATDSGFRTIFTRNVEGQEANLWLDEVERETSNYIKLKKREIAALLNK